ncbi:MAG: hypothetical protein WDZ93_03170 [Candidatus Paceibacterota bacterium]
MSLREKLKQLKYKTSRTLTDDERTEMKREFSAFMDDHPLSETPRPSLWIAFPWPYATYGAVGFATALLFTVGISEFSLPNDSLYAIKTGVNERVMLASTYFSPILYAEAGHTIFARRLEEAEQLMILEQFSSQTADAVQHQIDEQAHELNTSIDRAEASGNVTEANLIREKLNVTLAEYDPLLDILALRKEVSDPAIIDALIAEAVKEHIAERKKAALPDAFIEMELDVMNEYAQALLAELETMNQSISEHASMRKGRQAIFHTETVSKNLSTSNTERDHAEVALKEGDPERALEHLRTAITATQAALKEITMEKDTATE